MKKLIFILPLLYYSCTSDKVDTEEASKSDKLFELIKGVAKDNALPPQTGPVLELEL